MRVCMALGKMASVHGEGWKRSSRVQCMVKFKVRASRWKIAAPGEVGWHGDQNLSAELEAVMQCVQSASPSRRKVTRVPVALFCRRAVFTKMQKEGDDDTRHVRVVVVKGTRNGRAPAREEAAHHRRFRGQVGKSRRKRSGSPQSVHPKSASPAILPASQPWVVRVRAKFGCKTVDVI